MFQNPNDDTLKQILTDAKTIAVVGLSDNPNRTSFAVSQQMQQRGYRIIPVNPQVTEVLGEETYASLSEIPVPVDIINIFRNSEALPSVVEEAVGTEAPVIWAQLGIYHDDAVQIANHYGKTLVMDCCILVTHNALLHGGRRGQTE